MLDLETPGPYAGIGARETPPDIYHRPVREYVASFPMPN
jgi:hypothetical protein